MQHSDNDKLSDVQKVCQLMDGEWHELNQSECVVKLCADEKLREKWERYHLIRDAINAESVQVDQTLASRISAAIEAEPAYSNITPFAASDNAQVSQQSVDSEQAQSPNDQPGSLPTDVQDVEPQTAHNSQVMTNRKSLFNTGLSGFALAASVALLTIFGMNLFDRQVTTGSSASQIADNASQDDVTIGTVVTQGTAIADLSDSGTDAFSQQIDGAPLPVGEFVANSSTYWVSPDSAERVADEQRLNMMLSRHLDNSPTSGRSGLLPYSRLVGYDENVQDR